MRAEPADGPAIEELARFLDAGVTAGAAPSAQAAVIRDGAEVHASAHGADPEGIHATWHTLYDVASVTKVLATATAAAVLVARGALSLSTEVARLLPPFRGEGKDSVTVRELLAHGSGLPAWSPMFERAREDPVAGAIYPGPGQGSQGPTRAEAFARARELVVSTALTAGLTSSRGSRVYSDLGFIALGRLLEEAGGDRLDALARALVFEPFGLGATRFFDLAAGDRPGGHVMSTGSTRPREPAPGQEHLYRVHPQPARLDPGEVDDDNAFAMGGIAGHAGLFSTAREVARFGWLLLEEIEGAGRLGAGATLSAFTRPDTLTRGSVRGLGFDIPAPEGSLAGDLLGRGPLGAFGHLGFTGCSLWVDRDRRLSVALLTNRVYPTRHNVEPARAFRRAFHDLVARTIPGTD